MHRFVLSSLSTYFKSTIFNFPVFKILATLEDSEFSQRVFFFSFRLFYYLNNLWVRQTSSVRAVSATTVLQEIRAALTHSTYSFMFLVMESVEWSLQPTCYWLWHAVPKWKARSCNLDVGEPLPCIFAPRPVISWFNLKSAIFGGWNCWEGRLALGCVHQDQSCHFVKFVP